MTEGLRHPAVGVGLLTLLAGWAYLSVPAAPEALSYVGAFLLLAAGMVAGWSLTAVHPAIPGGLVFIGVVAMFSATAPESLSGDPLAPPLHYGNANGALLSAAAAGAVVAASRYRLPVRAMGAGAALAAGALASTIQAQAAALTALLLAVWGLFGIAGRAGPAMVTAGIALAVPVAATFAWASDLLSPPTRLVMALSEERFDLWADAWDLIVAQPVVGVGAGRFAELSPTAQDPDLAWAHSYALQVGSELGLVGLGLVVLLLAWGVLALGRAAPVLALLLLPASVDYILQFPWVLVASSVVVGSALASDGKGKPWLTPPSP